MGYLFEWDTKKAESNARKHGITFDEACTVFGDPLAILKLDPDHSAEQERYLLLGCRVVIGCWWWLMRSDRHARA